MMPQARCWPAWGVGEEAKKARGGGEDRGNSEVVLY